MMRWKWLFRRFYREESGSNYVTFRLLTRNFLNVQLRHVDSSNWGTLIHSCRLDNLVTKEFSKKRSAGCCQASCMMYESNVWSSRARLPYKTKKRTVKTLYPFAIHLKFCFLYLHHVPRWKASKNIGRLYLCNTTCAIWYKEPMNKLTSADGAAVSN